MTRSLLLVALLALTACPPTEKPADTDTGSIPTDDADRDGYDAAEDCDDTNAAVNPGASETCDGVDNDCDGTADEEVKTTYYVDADEDGYGDALTSTEACQMPAGYVPTGNDCDDTVAAVYPGAPEQCDGLDNNCDGTADEGVLNVFYADGDGDGYGGAGSPTEACTAPTGYVADDQDCDDTTASVHPGADEICDEQDNDCDDTADEDVRTRYYIDADGDGYGTWDLTQEGCTLPTGYAANPDDCNDALEDVNPAATEFCDGLDNDCDGAEDETDAADARTWYADADADGYGTAATTTRACDPPTGFVDNATDCDDAESAANPGAAEVCDAVDNDCDGDIDEATATGAPTWYLDADGDGIGTADVTVRQCEPPAGYVATEGDCDDLLATVHPGAYELCDGADNDCDGATDEEDATDATTWYRDRDGDGWGDEATTLSACYVPSGYVAEVGDCDDTDATVSPTVEETCDGLDNDCDGDADESGAIGESTWYADRDADGHGDPTQIRVACTAPTSHVAVGDDCDDTTGAVNPDLVESCDGLDNDCDGTVDEDTAVDVTRWYADVDGDTWGNAASSVKACEAPAGYVTSSTDCDDAERTVHPTATEDCDDVDDDCDGTVDEGLTIYTSWVDADGDGYGSAAVSVSDCAVPAGYVNNDDDCEDASAAIHPGVAESCDDLDNDCDSTVDEGLALRTSWIDADGDGYGDPSTTISDCGVPSGFVTNDDDCADADRDRYPGAAELCDGVDNDCDGSADEGVVSYTWYQDADGDGYGLTTATVSSCSRPAGFSASYGDCNDAASSINPGAVEVCDTVDNDCDGSTDEGVGTTWYRDADGDGWGATASTASGCTMPSGYAGLSGDCDDARASSYPGASESCDSVDNDCDGSVDEGVLSTWYRDADSDGYGTAATVSSACTAPSGYVSNATDCDDGNAAASPAGSEVCDGADNDCDGSVDEAALGASTWYADTDADGYGDPLTTTSACTAPTGYVSDATDCEPADGTAYPGSTTPDYPGDDVDQDCDGLDGCSDLNCDGWPDIVFPANRSASSTFSGVSTYVYYFTGFGFSSSYRTALSTNGSTGVVVEDFDYDGWLDLFVLNELTSSTVFSVDSYLFYGSASGFSSSDRLDIPTVGALDAAVADLDEDGFADLVVANYYTGSSYSTSSYIYWGSVSGYNSADRTSLATYGPYDVEIADLDEDGYQDIVFANYRQSSSVYTTNSYVYWGSSAGYSSSDRTSLATNGARKVLVEDVNDDGWTDLVFACYRDDGDTTTNSYVYYGSAAGYSSSNRDDLGTYGAVDVAAGDLNADGYLDLVFADYNDGDYKANSYVYWGASGGYSSSSRTALVTYGACDVEIADLNADGWDDLTFANYYTGSSYSTNSYLFWNTKSSSSGYFTSSSMTSLPTYGPTRVRAADLDLDGWPDLVFNNTYNGSSYVIDSYVYYSTSGTFSSSVRDDLPTYSPWGPAAVVGTE